MSMAALIAAASPRTAWCATGDDDPDDAPAAAREASPTPSAAGETARAAAAGAAQAGGRSGSADATAARAAAIAPVTAAGASPSADGDGAALLANVETSFAALVTIVGKEPAGGSRAVSIARDELDSAQDRLRDAIVGGLARGDDTAFQLFLDRITRGGEFARAALAGTRRQLIRALKDRANQPGGEHWAAIAGQLPGSVPKGAAPRAAGGRPDDGQVTREISEGGGVAGEEPAAPTVIFQPYGTSSRGGPSGQPVGTAQAPAQAGSVDLRPVIHIAASLAYFGGQAAQELGQALERTGRFQVRSGPGQPGERAYEVRLQLDPVRVSTWPRAYPHLYVINRPGGRSPLFCNQFVAPYDYDQTVWVHGRLQVVDLAAGQEVGRGEIAGSAFSSPTYFPGHGIGGVSWYGAPGYPADQWALSRALDSAITDTRSGALRTVLDALPMRGKILTSSAGSPPVVTIDLGARHGARANDRFVVLSPGGEEAAIVRPREVGSDTSTARVYGLRGNDPPPVAAGDSIVSRGY